MIQQQVTIIDYGMGNLWSVTNALRYLGYSSEITGDPKKIAKASSLILPGVGSYRKAMSSLMETGIAHAIGSAVTSKTAKILGICLGMQLLGKGSTEDGDTIGLGLISADVGIFQSSDVGFRKVPHIGFDQVQAPEDSILFRGLGELPDFYFVHSYRMLPQELPGNQATCNYGINFLAAYEHENIFATQFHPEKSQANGLRLLSNFLSQ